MIGHSVFGVSRVDLARATILLVSISASPRDWDGSQDFYLQSILFPVRHRAQGCTDACTVACATNRRRKNRVAPAPARDLVSWFTKPLRSGTPVIPFSRSAFLGALPILAVLGISSSH